MKKNQTKSMAYSSSTTQVNPRSLAEVGIYKFMKPTTRNKYVKTWTDFCDQMEITTEKPPVEEDFMDFFEKLKGLFYCFSQRYFKENNEKIFLLQMI